MNVDELKELFKSQKLTLHMHKRRSKGKEYVYAAWRDGKKVKQRYVAPFSRMQQMTTEQVLEQLARIEK